MKNKPIDSELMHKMFRYAEGNLYNRTTRRKSSAAGGIAGSLTKSGYTVVMVKAVRYKQHRIVYAMFNPDFDQSMQIDHIDGNKLNNRIDNLRIATNAENVRNQKVLPNNKLGVQGVRVIKSSRINPFMARIRVDGELIYLGIYPTIDAASKAYQDARIKYFGEFA